MYKYVLLLILLIHYSWSSNNEDDEEDSAIRLLQSVPVTSSQSNYVRCTRRYTPGFCISAVVSVWTFVFQLQNCTERLGCPARFRSNRYRTYNSCMRRCSTLVNLYTDILSRDPRNITAYLRARSWRYARREITDQDPEIYAEEDDEEGDDNHKDDSIEGPDLRPGDERTRSDAVLPDIDYIGEDDDANLM